MRKSCANLVDSLRQSRSQTLGLSTNPMCGIPRLRISLLVTHTLCVHFPAFIHGLKSLFLPVTIYLYPLYTGLTIKDYKLN